MKSILYISLFMICVLFACNDGTKDSEAIPNRAIGKITNPTGPSTKPTAKNGMEVESETRVADPNYNDANVDYTKLANDICQCSQESSVINQQMELLADQKKSKEFAAMAPQLSKAFSKSVKCSKEVSNKLGSEFSPYTLVPQMKNTCPDLPADLVAQILRSFGVNI